MTSRQTRLRFELLFMAGRGDLEPIQSKRLAAILCGKRTCAPERNDCHSASIVGCTMHTLEGVPATVVTFTNWAGQAVLWAIVKHANK